MSEEKKNITAKDLLSRLGKTKNDSAPDKKTGSADDEIEIVYASEIESVDEISKIRDMISIEPQFIDSDAQITEKSAPVFDGAPEYYAADERKNDEKGEDNADGGIPALFDEDFPEIEFPSYDFPEPGEVVTKSVGEPSSAEDADDAQLAPEFADADELNFELPDDDFSAFVQELEEMSDLSDFDEAEEADEVPELTETEEITDESAAEFADFEEFADFAEAADESEENIEALTEEEQYEPEEDIPDLTEEETVAFEEAAGLAADYEGEDYSEYAEEIGLSDEMDEDFGSGNTAEEYESYSADIIPDESFFDEDPLENESEIEENDAEYDENGEMSEADREEEFKNLVEEVTGEGDDTELNESDIGLMVALGMEDELVKTVGEETAAQMTEDYVADQEEWVDRTNRFGPGEYSDPSENAVIAEEYKKRNKFAIIKLIAAIVFAAALMVLENLPVIGYELSGALDSKVYPVVFVMIDLQLALFCAATVWNNIKRGFADSVKFKITVDTIPSLMLAATVVSCAITAYTAVPGKSVSVFNFPAALCFVLTALSEYLTVRREIFSFNVVSSKKRKFVMRNLSTRDSLLESEAVSDLELDSSAADEGDIIKIQETDFVDGYFWRTKNRSTANDGYVGLAIVIALVLAVIAAIYAGISKQAQVISAGYAVFTAAMPALMMVIGAYPFFVANSAAYENDSTIIGESSVEEYSGVGVLSFDDVNVFRSQNVKVKNVRLFNNSRIDKVLYYAASVFAATGGPLSEVFDVATREMGHSDDVRVLETGTGYIEAEVNGKNIVFGRAAALAKLGIIIPDDVISDNTELPPDCSVMYMIYQRKLVSKMVVNYVIEPDFEFVLKELTGSGMCVCVKTFDPNIDEEMIYRQLHSTGKYSMRVIKYKTTDEITKYAKRSEGGIVSRGNTKALLRTVSVCDKILSAQKTGYIIGILSAVFGAAIVAVMLISGSFQSLFSLYIALCQLLWLIPAVISTKLIVK